VSSPGAGFRIEPLGRTHSRATFSCGDEALDRYFREQAGQDVRRRVAAVFVLVQVADGRIAGYYTLSSASLRSDDLSREMMKALPHYPYLPATLLGRLAVDTSFHGQRLGELLLLDALRRAWQVTSQIGSLWVIVDAGSDRARRFYARYGFLSLPDSPMRLFLPMNSIEGLFT
jgi:GNAT superfamily N-acetyltransferase